MCADLHVVGDGVGLLVLRHLELLGGCGSGDGGALVLNSVGCNKFFCKSHHVGVSLLRFKQLEQTQLDSMQSSFYSKFLEQDFTQ